MKLDKKTHAMNNYKPSGIEEKWQRKWEDTRLYQPNLEKSTRPFYNLHMFPYPSAEGLHVGNVYAFTGADVSGRFHRMLGYTVFQPFGLDGFGIHSENYALKVGSHPMEQAQKSEGRFYAQVGSLGSGYDWNRLLETYDIDYYRWTQWLFVELFKAGLAYRAESEVNWCPSCKTVLADEQVIDGKCERCNSIVEKKMLAQWFFKITTYAEELLEGLNKIDWTEKVKIAQRNWIGKSEGARLRFQLKEDDIKRSSNYIEVFTTRPDTLYGATFMVISPNHPVALEIAKTDTDVAAYLMETGKKTAEEKREAKEKNGVFSKTYALNPINNEQIPIWIADYVLMEYGTGAIMAVPAHDQRDYDFAKKYNLPIREVISGGDISKEAYVGQGRLINSGEWNDWEMPQNITKAIKWLEDNAIGQKEVEYHLRDWLISRQRYWGPPIPMIYCEKCAQKRESWFTTLGKKTKPLGVVDHEAVAGWYPEEKLPVELPFIDDYKPLGTGKSPLGNHPEFYETTCPHCGEKATRETDVSDTFLDSSWYFLRYLATDLSTLPFPLAANRADSLGGEKEEMNKAVARLPWLPVTQYIGGAEHSVLHLLYTRFVYKVLCDLHLVDRATGDEPFPKFFAHGLIIKDGAKMSKSKGNVVVPDAYVKKFGADTLRTYLMFLGPFGDGGDFKDAGIEGMHRFLRRVWVMGTGKNIASTELSSSANVVLHKIIKGVTDDLTHFRYNTAIAKIMTLYNALSAEQELSRDAFMIFLQLLAPFAPHIAEELWEQHGGTYSIHTSSWPTFDETALVEDEVVVVVQINGKTRADLRISKDVIGDREGIEKLARGHSRVLPHLESKKVKKVIYIQGKILNFVV